MTELELQQIEIQKLKEELAKAEAKLLEREIFTIKENQPEIQVRRIFLISDNSEISSTEELEQYLAMNPIENLKFELTNGEEVEYYNLGEEQWI